MRPSEPAPKGAGAAPPLLPLQMLAGAGRQQSNMQLRTVPQVGLDSAGKTTILYKLKLGENLPTVPTIGAQLGGCARSRRGGAASWESGRGSVSPHAPRQRQSRHQNHQPP